ncbi:DUF2189 domain-containing protein [Caldovatus aquaticus]|uniref:DUF2189 domain-containing protein n=1 Tax=Caldovatus aquaticus TaxID=2865671 RepID=A0ABS7F0S6_9PROT|nr:DUF2189 domain-containing protein [Caldovatus aquaticus]MBW8269108.1 DUF2189 domain-containing protein [Caldovatus aquaticus]
MSFDVTPEPPPSAPGSRIRLVPVDRPWVWLTEGWRDLMAAPHVGFTYGAALTACGWALVLLLLWAGALWAILPATAGFFLVAPLLAAGLYEASRRREAGEAVTLAACARGFTRNASQLALMGVVLLLLHLFWVRVAALIFGLFFGINFAPPLEQLPLAMLRSDALLPFLVVGTAVGAAFALAAFAVSAVSIPMLVDRDITAVEAVLVSIRTVAANPAPMAFWAGLIVVFTAMALVPFFLGLTLVLPLIGHATWHAYRDLVR